MIILTFLVLLFLVLLLPVFCWILIGTITFIFDTNTNEYSIILVGGVAINLLTRGGRFFITIKVPFYRKIIDVEKSILDAYGNGKSLKRKSGKIEKKANYRLFEDRIKKNWLRVLRTFKVIKFRINVDTDNYLANSLLFPVAYFAQRNGYQIGINYLGRQDVSVVLENRLARILLALLKP
jgi:hypothetical protein